MTHYKRITLLACLLLLQASIACAQTSTTELDVIRETGQGQFDFSSKKIRELSGITHLGDDQFALVSDKGGKLGTATIKIDPESGKILGASLTQTLVLQGGKDVEDLAFDPSTCLLITVDEADQSLAYHHLPSGGRIQTISAPDIFKQARSNLGFESLAVSLHTGSIWAANEEPLKKDGPRATKDAGALVRLQRFSHDLKPDGQYAYRVDAHRGSDNLIGRAQSGVSGLVALPSGQLIVMERELGGAVLPSFRIRLYLIDASEATDTSKLVALADRQINPVEKTLLYEFNAGLANFEGITLGPQLDDGDYTLILVSDNGGGTRNPQNLFSLRIAASMVESKPSKSIPPTGG
ncbi:MAG: esterase-like activity of phytase family protein [Phycisphaeraceae bacterium]